MKGRKSTINLIWANIFGLILILVLAIAASILWKHTWGFDNNLHALVDQEGHGGLSIALFVIAVLAGMVVHELIHGATWALFACGRWRSISFGIKWSVLSPYCHCNEMITMRQYRLGIVMPLIILGIIPLVIGFLLGAMLMVTYGVLFTAFAAGDILVALKLLREKPHVLVVDHPRKAGCIIYDEEYSSTPNAKTDQQ